MRDGSWVRVVQGKVLSVKRWSDTHIGSTGGGGYVGARGGVVRAPTITSNVVQRSQVFVQRQDGVEEALELGDLMPLREGQTITAIYGGIAPDSGQLLLLHNHQSDSTFANPLQPSAIGPAFFFLLALFGTWFVAAILVMPMASVLALDPNMVAAGYAAQHSSPSLDSSYMDQAIHRYYQCRAAPQHHLAPCGSDEEPIHTSAGPTICICKATNELQHDMALERRQVALQSGNPSDSTFGAAFLIMLIVGGISGFVIAVLVYKNQMRSGLRILETFLADAAKETFPIAGLALTVASTRRTASLAMR